MPILKVISNHLDQKVPVKIWSKEVEFEAEDQLIKTSRLPFVFKHVAVMPDVHAGKGSIVGTVIATKGAICPATVGVDIGCGMAAIKTPLNAKLVQDQIKEIRHSIERSIPVGFNSHKTSRAPGADKLVGATIIKAGNSNWKTVKDGDDDYEVIESMGSKFKTSKGYVDIETRLEHNGYYSGDIEVSSKPFYKYKPEDYTDLKDF